MLSLSACNGILEGIYDAPSREAAYGFIAVDETARTGRIYIDATDYTQWHYIDLHDKRVESVKIEQGAAAPEHWDFAVHRYDAKTNGGRVAETPSETLDRLPDPGSLPETDFAADEWTTEYLRVDISQMIDGIIRYTEDYCNLRLSQWLDVDTSTMPPVYTLSNKVYLLRLEDGTCAALRLADFMNDAAAKGFMTIDYIYPVE